MANSEKKVLDMMDVIDIMQEKIRSGEVKPLTDEEIEAHIQAYRREKFEKKDAK